MGLSKIEFTEGFLLKAFIVTHAGNFSPIESPYRNSKGYWHHFDEENCQIRWEEWQVCANAILVLMNSVIE